MNQTVLVPQPDLTVQVDFAWGKFRNLISIKNGDALRPLFTQEFKGMKGLLIFESAVDSSIIATSKIHGFKICAETTIRGQEIQLKPLSKLRTHYNYLSYAMAPNASAGPVPISWEASCNMKTWDYLCLNHKRECMAKFSVNNWSMKQVGKFHFPQPADQISDAARDEIIITGVTLLYTMMLRVNNPFNLLGAAFTSTGEAKGGRETPEKKKEKEEELSAEDAEVLQAILGV